MFHSNTPWNSQREAIPLPNSCQVPRNEPALDTSTHGVQPCRQGTRKRAIQSKIHSAERPSRVQGCKRGIHIFLSIHLNFIWATTPIEAFGREPFNHSLRNGVIIEMYRSRANERRPNRKCHSSHDMKFEVIASSSGRCDSGREHVVSGSE